MIHILFYTFFLSPSIRNNQHLFFKRLVCNSISNNVPGNPSYSGQVFYPLDIEDNSTVREALWTLRQLKQKDHLSLNIKKELEILQSCGNQEAATLTLVGYKGKPSPNQDRAVAIVPFLIGHDKHHQHEATPTTTSLSQPHDEKSSSTTISSRLIAVFDGHARFGEMISEYAVTHLPQVLAKKLDQLFLSKKVNNKSVKTAIIDTFIEVDRDCPGENFGGCTASVVLQQGTKLYVANTGDSRSFVVVYRPTRQRSVEIIYISREDVPHLPGERRRIEECGGKVVVPPEDVSRVLYDNPITRELCGLSMSRAIGVWPLRKLGVIPDPIVDVIDIDQVVESQVLKDCPIPEKDGTMSAAGLGSLDDVHIFAVSATDGLLKFVPPEEIAKGVAHSLYDDNAPYLLSAVENLIKEASSEWEYARQRRYRDDIAVSVTAIRRPPTAAPSKQP
jgi:serine/threonine protein phosphatase PrpC